MWVFCKKMFVNILQNSQKKHLYWGLFFNKAVGGNLKLSEAATGDVL